MISVTSIRFLVLFLSLSCFLLFAEQKEGQEPSSSPPSEQTLTTRRSIKTINGTIEYTVQLGDFILKNDQDKPAAKLFYTAYYVEPAEKGVKRPLIFCFNGGPGSASAWLHIGNLGPKIVKMDDEGYPILPYGLEDNPHTLLAVADLVFIDPVGTGFSRALPGEDPKQFYNYEADLQSVGQFITLFLNRFDRWEAPKYLLGESYGTTRAAGLSNHLLKHSNIALNGIALVSSVLDFSVFQELSGLSCWLPTYAITARYYNRLSPALQKMPLSEFLAEVENFSMKTYLPALYQGDMLDKATYDAVLEKLAAYTALSPEYLKKAYLKVPMGQFVKELLRSENRSVGRFDSRLLAIDNNLNGAYYEYDPSMTYPLNAFTAAINQYLRADLGYKTDEEYILLASGLAGSWKFCDNDRLEVSQSLKETMSRNPNMRVFVASGLYDMAIPYLSTDMTFAAMDLDPSLRPNVSIKKYPGGHMMYLERPLLRQLNSDLSSFIQTTATIPFQPIRLP